MKIKSVVVSIMMLFAGLQVHAANCGASSGASGYVVCFTAVGTLSNANQSTSSPVVMYTAPSGGNGARISAILALGAVSSGSGAGTAVWLMHNSTDYSLINTSVPIASGGYSAPANMLLVNGSAAATFTTPLVDENGDPFIYLSAGDSIAISNNVGIPSSGSTSGTYYFYIIGQSY
jgi:hypothetical protein